MDATLQGPVPISASQERPITGWSWSLSQVSHYVLGQGTVVWTVDDTHVLTMHISTARWGSDNFFRPWLPCLAKMATCWFFDHTPAAGFCARFGLLWSQGSPMAVGWLGIPAWGFERQLHFFLVPRHPLPWLSETPWPGPGETASWAHEHERWERQCEQGSEGQEGEGEVTTAQPYRPQ